MSPFSRQGNGGSEKLSNSPKVTNIWRNGTLWPTGTHSLCKGPEVGPRNRGKEASRLWPEGKWKRSSAPAKSYFLGLKPGASTGCGFLLSGAQLSHLPSCAVGAGGGGRVRSQEK